ncbi:MAG: Na+/H+ antiporter NhaC [Eubacteriales bacterium]|nr:Na+/H+ antiporter NhaC [Eubacteriales bacterium]
MKPTKEKQPRQPKTVHALIVFAVLIFCMAIGIIKYDAGVHISMFIGVCAAAAMALYLGFSWKFIEDAMREGILNALQAVIILMIVGILVGIWILSGVVPTMIYYGMKLLSPSIFLVASVLICSITSLATGTSWGTMGTMGLALIGIATGLGIPTPVAAGAVISGAYFGDKMSPLSDTTNLAPAMAGTDIFTHIKFMMLPTGIAYAITLAIFGILGLQYGHGGSVDMSAVTAMNEGITSVFNISPVLLLPPVIVIVLVACKVPAIPGITIGIFAGAILGFITQPGINFGDILVAGMNGFTCESGVETLDNLLSTGGIENMLFSVSLTLIAMMFGGIMEKTGMLNAVVSKIIHLAKRPATLVLTTEITCILSNITMPEQYISVVVPGRMYADAYREMNLHPKTLSNALESAGTVTSALIPWNTCGVYIYGVLGVSAFAYFPYAIFNIITPIITVILAFAGIAIAKQDSTDQADRAV